ncbi:RDD family protein [Peribacillus simplex]|uniref:RDD family protein n=1 Tax=Peribacillus simplex TaxID=1478 RepID=UPI000F62E2FF|nr:RDD family protein [Peribacillus simplex]RRN66794.1 RDD family protein [Peribacillus simplex]
MTVQRKAGSMLDFGFWLRFGANIIDGIIIGIPTGILSVFMIIFLSGATMELEERAMDPNNEASMNDLFVFMSGTIIILFLSMLISFLYYSLLHSPKWQGSVGKILLNRKVTDLYGERIGFGRAAGRYFATNLSGMIFYIGYIMAGLRRRNRHFTI